MKQISEIAGKSLTVRHRIVHGSGLWTITYGPSFMDQMTHSLWLIAYDSKVITIIILRIIYDSAWKPIFFHHRSRLFQRNRLFQMTSPAIHKLWVIIYDSWKYLHDIIYILIYRSKSLWPFSVRVKIFFEVIPRFRIYILWSRH